MNKIKVMMVGSAKKSNGGVAAVISLLSESYIWKEYDCYWLETQIQSSKLVKLYYAFRAYIVACLILPKYNIIHFHTVPDVSLIVQFPVFLLAKLWHKKIILHLHVGNQIEDARNNKLFLFCMKNSNIIIVLSSIWKKKIEQIFPSISTPIQIVYNPTLDIGDVDTTKRSNIIIFSAHMNRNKGYDIMLRGFRGISDEFKDWKLIMMGDGEVEKARSLAVSLGIADRVSFPGYVRGKEKENLLSMASIFCLCSFKEGLPMVVMEAWEYGIPVITTPAGALCDLIEENKNGITFNFGDYNALEYKLKNLILDKELREQMSLFSKFYVKQNFSLNTIADKLSCLYSEL